MQETETTRRAPQDVDGKVAWPTSTFSKGTEAHSWWHHAAQRSVWALVRLSITFPWTTLLVAVVLAGVAVWYTSTHLTFRTSRNALVSPTAPYIQRAEDIDKDFHDLDAFIVAVEPQRLERGKQFVDALTARLRTDTRHFSRVVDKIDTSSLEGKKLLLLSPDELRTLQQRLQEAQGLLTDLAGAPGLQQLLVSINQEISKALAAHLTTSFLETSSSSATATAAEEQTLDVTFLAALLSEMEYALADPASYRFHSPWASFFLKDSKVLSHEGYLTSANDRLLFVLVEDRPAESSFIKHAPPLQALRAHIQALQRDFPDVQAGVTGSRALGSDEMASSQRDTALATVISLIGVGLLYIAIFWEVWSPLRVQITLQLAVCWSLGFTALTIGHLNILSVSFAPILIGLADNLGIHLAARYSEERAAGRDFYTAMAIAARQTGPGIVTAAIAVALAFYAVMLADFPGLAELGFIAGSGELFCLLASFTVLPALSAVSQRALRIRPVAWQPQHRASQSGLGRFPRLTLGVLGGLTLLGLLVSPWPRFDYNLLHLQAKGTESVMWEHRLLADAERSSWYAVSTANSLEELHRKQAQFAALPGVEHVESLAALLPTNQEERLTVIAELAPLVASVSDSWEEVGPIAVEDLVTVLEKMRFKLQRPPTDWDPNKRPSEAGLTAARAALVAVQERLQTLPPALAGQGLETFQRALMADFATKLALLQRNIAPPGPVTLADMPSYLHERFVGKSGHYLLQIFARDNIWDREPMQTFVTQMQAVDADVTGPPVVAWYSIQSMQQGYVRGGVYAFLAIGGLTLLHFRRLMPTLLALLPLGVAACWMLPWMGLCGVHLNIANLMVIPLFMAMAIDNGIHLVDRALETPKAAAARPTQSTGKAVLLSSLTTIVGFGSLMVARHTGIFSFGLLVALSVSSQLLAVFTILPLLLQLVPLHPVPASPQRAQDRALIMARASVARGAEGVYQLASR
jgi:hopanoid biosynthesis associated RND transporter like protein HpnN